MEWLIAEHYEAARWLLTRLLGALYALAFVNAAVGWPALLGDHGLLPVRDHLRRSDWRQEPSLFHWRYSETGAVAVAWTGAVLAATLAVGLVQQGPSWLSLAVWLICWVLYLSIVHVGQIWYAFGWETILLEAGFFAAFLGADADAPSWAAILLLRWLVFRIEFGAGLIKLRGDPCWRDLTCLEYHHETQPLPGPLSWWAHHRSRWWHKVEVAGNHCAQLVVPFGLFLPQPVAGIAGAVVILTQSWLLLTGNFAWLNAVTVVLALAAVPDAWLAALPVDLRSGTLPGWLAVTTLAVAAVTLVLSWWPVRNMLSRGQAMNVSFNPLRLVGSYGAFGAITRERYELVIEGAATDGGWREYEFPGKPGDPARRPPQIAPWHLRLDWLLWFAAMSPRPGRGHRWLPRLIGALLAGNPHVRRLLRTDPFPDAPPARIRVLRYRYRFSTPEERRRTGAFWQRTPVGEFLPPVSRGDVPAPADH